MAKEKLFESYLTTASSLVQQYDASIPLNDFLRQYFSLHKKFGSRDRKYITELCYCNFRTGHLCSPRSLKGGLLNTPLSDNTEERILLSLFLCSQKQNDLLAQLKPEWNEKADYSLEDKISFLNYPLNVTNIFPWKNELSKTIDPTAFAAYHLIQPDLFFTIKAF